MNEPQIYKYNESNNLEEEETPSKKRVTWSEVLEDRIEADDEVLTLGKSFLEQFSLGACIYVTWVTIVWNYNT